MSFLRTYLIAMTQKNDLNQDTNQGGKAVARLGISIALLVLFIYFLGVFMMPVYAR